MAANKQWTVIQYSDVHCPHAKNFGNTARIVPLLCILAIKNCSGPNNKSTCSFPHANINLERAFSAMQ